MAVVTRHRTAVVRPDPKGPVMTQRPTRGIPIGCRVSSATPMVGRPATCGGGGGKQDGLKGVVGDADGGPSRNLWREGCKRDKFGQTCNFWCRGRTGCAQL